MPDSLPVAKIKREIALLKRLHKERSIDEMQWLERMDPPPKDPRLDFARSFAESARKEKQSLEEQLAVKIASLESVLEAEERCKGSAGAPAPKRARDRSMIRERLYVEDVGNFANVSAVSREMVGDFLAEGYLAITEDQVQTALEQILGVPFHRKDWGGELNDLCTANVTVGGARRAAAFLLKGRGLGRKEMTIADCGKHGDQIVRLFDTPCDLFVVQYVGPIADLLVKDVQGKVAQLRAARKDASFIIMDGQDTARVLLAYGKL